MNDNMKDNIIGDYTVRILISPDGVMRMVIPNNARHVASELVGVYGSGGRIDGFGATPEAA